MPNMVIRYVVLHEDSQSFLEQLPEILQNIYYILPSAVDNRAIMETFSATKAVEGEACHLLLFLVPFDHHLSVENVNRMQAIIQDDPAKPAALIKVASGSVFHFSPTGVAQKFLGLSNSIGTYEVPSFIFTYKAEFTNIPRYFSLLIGDILQAVKFVPPVEKGAVEESDVALEMSAEPAAEKGEPRTSEATDQTPMRHLYLQVVMAAKTYKRMSRNLYRQAMSDGNGFIQRHCVPEGAVMSFTKSSREVHYLDPSEDISEVSRVANALAFLGSFKSKASRHERLDQKHKKSPLTFYVLPEMLTEAGVLTPELDATVLSECQQTINTLPNKEAAKKRLVLLRITEDKEGNRLVSEQDADIKAFEINVPELGKVPVVDIILRADRVLSLDDRKGLLEAVLTNGPVLSRLRDKSIQKQLGAKGEIKTIKRGSATEEDMRTSSVSDADDLAAVPARGNRLSLVRGRVVEIPENLSTLAGVGQFAPPGVKPAVAAVSADMTTGH